MSKTYGHYRDYPMSQWRWPNFSPREMASKGEGELKIDENAMDRLQALRKTLDKPLIITSAYRSVAHNRRVGGATNSMHLQGKAFDVSMVNHNPREFIQAARQHGFRGIGQYPNSNFVHIDTGPARAWGTPFPDTVTKLPVERTPAPDRMREDTDAIAAGGAAIAGGAASAMDYLPFLGPMLGNLAPVAQTLALVIAGLCVAYILYHRYRRTKG